MAMKKTADKIRERDCNFNPSQVVLHVLEEIDELREGLEGLEGITTGHARRLAALEKDAHKPYDCTALVNRIEAIEKLVAGVSCLPHVPAPPLGPVEKKIVTYFLWLDLETTGLDPVHDSILEVAWSLTDSALASFVFGGLIVLYLPAVLNALVESLSSEVREMHTKNHLLDDLERLSQAHDAYAQSGWDVRRIERKIIANIGALPKATESSEVRIVLAGNSPHFDKEFLRWNMPTLHRILHYRIFDMSSLNAAHRAWIGELPKGEPAHRAMADVEESLRTARFFQEMFKAYAARA